MSKRKLSRQQQFRIDRVQQERLARAKKKNRQAEDMLSDGQLKDTEPGLVMAHFGATIDVESTEGEVFRCHVRSNLPALVTGDQVVWQRDDQGGGVISAVEPRRSILTRPDTRGRLRPVAANVDRIVIVVAPAPRTPTNLIDRYLVATAHDDIEPIILLNKQDLLDQAPELKTELQQYEALGYQTLTASAKDDEGLETIQNLVKTGNSVFVGQSGVGKSSIIDRLLPNENLKVGDISAATGKGRHTTTTARIYHIPTGGQLVDSPGIREFGLWHTEPADLDKGFPEIYRFAAECKFRDCTHTHEPGCRVKQAIAEGDVLPRRLESFLAIRDSVDEVTIRDHLS